MRVFVIKMSDVGKCPTRRLDPMHYRDDGSCKCIAAKKEKEHEQKPGM